MKNPIKLLFILAFAAGNLFAQTEKYSAPVKWQKYKVSEREVSVLLPKMPVLLFSSDNCVETESRRYYAYAEDVIYSFKITSKTNEKARNSCLFKKKFSRETFVERLQEIRTVSKDFTENNFKHDEREVTQIISKTSTIWLFDDLKNDRWFELSVNHRENVKPDTKKFIESIKIKENPEGIEIGKGSERTLGDEKQETENSSDVPSAEKSSTVEETESLMIIAKPSPRYTEAARQTGTQGTVSLKVTFLANGGIGSLFRQVKNFPNGLTHQAIISAQKLVFLPHKKNGKRCNGRQNSRV